MIGWALGLALAAPPTPDAHGHADHCPAAPQLAGIVARRPLSDAERACVEGEPPESARGNAYGWVALVDTVVHRKQRVDSGALTALGAHLAAATPALTAAEQLSAHPELQQQVLEAAAAWLSQQSWDIGWSRSQHRVAELSPALGAGLSPRAPRPDDLSVCRDVGRLQARALFGGVYAAERDCAVRAAEVAAGVQRRTWARLAWALTLQHGVAEEQPWVEARLVALALDPATL